ncbi:MAG: tail fiber domain-containing protein [Bacteroidia bacterium]|nr:tail fiber domain-containing protein [Bacteroidia bacterium]
MGTTDNQPLAFRTNGTEHMRLSETGFLGIGTTTPAQRLHVVGNLHLQGAFMPAGNAGTAGAILTSQGAGTPPSWLAGTAVGQVLTWTATGPQWQAVAAPNAWLLTGNLGTNPTINFIGTVDNQPLRVGVNNTTRAFFTNYGLLVYADYAAGTNMPAGTYPGIRPYSTGSLDAAGIVEADRDGSLATQNDKDLLIYWSDDFDDRVRFVHYSWNGAGTTPATADAIRIMASGNVGVNVSTDPTFTLEVNGSAAKPGGGTWTTISDARLKEVEGPYKRGLTKLLQLRPVWYRYRQNASYPFSDAVLKERYIGFLAQEVLSVFPEAVRLSPAGYYTLDAYPIHIATLNAIRELHERDQSLLEQFASSVDEIHSEIQRLRIENQHLQSENKELRRRLERLEKVIYPSLYSQEGLSHK